MAARAYYNLALEAAREVKDHQLAAASLGLMSIIPAREDRNFQAALDLLDGACSSAAKAVNPMLASWIAALEADVHALAGNTAAPRALDYAESTLERVVPEEIPPWLDYYDARRLEGFKGFLISSWAGPMMPASYWKRRWPLSIPQRQNYAQSIPAISPLPTHTKVNSKRGVD